MVLELTEIRAFRKKLRSMERELAFSLLSQTSCCGVTTAQCHLLLEIEERRESSLGELAAALELDSSTLSRTVDGLVAMGLVSRAVDPTNRRRQSIALSAAGVESVACINASCDSYYSKLLGEMPDEKRGPALDALASLAEAMRRLRTGGDTCCPPAAAERSL
jgi:DNA-binding MarR family transcriptional regulator